MSYNENENNRLNFEEKIAKCKGILNLWLTRNLTLLGRTQIVKTFIISQFSYVTSAITIPDTYLEQINRLIFKFIWRNKKDKLKRNVMHNNIEKGGLKVPDIFSIVKASRFTWVKRYMSPRNHIWKTLFENSLLKSNLNYEMLFFCNFNIKQWTKKELISRFNQEILTEWFQFNSMVEINKDKIIWYNKNILVQGQPIFYPDFSRVGITYISDLYSDTKELRDFAFWKAKGLKNNDFLKWAGLVSAVIKYIPKDQIEQVPNHTLELEDLNFLDRPFNTVTSKLVYDHLIHMKCGENAHTPRINKYTNFQEVDWSMHYITALTIPLDTKTREFQFKFLHDVLINNYWLKKWNLAETDLCTFCMSATEDIFHLFWQCEVQ